MYVDLKAKSRDEWSLRLKTLLKDNKFSIHYDNKITFSNYLWYYSFDQASWGKRSSERMCLRIKSNAILSYLY